MDTGARNQIEKASNLTHTTDDRGCCSQDNAPFDTDGANQVGGTDGIVEILASYHPDTLVDEVVLAKSFNKDTRTIRRWEKEGILPPRIPGIRMWRVGSILNWFAMKTEAEEKRVRIYLAQLAELNE